MLSDVLPSWPVFSADERAAVEECLRSGRVNYWTGVQGKEFEGEYAAYLGKRHAIALMNGTVALELPLRIWGVGPGDEVIVTPRSFMASTSCVVAVGARPVFADVDRDSGNLTAETIAAAITPRTRAVVLVHLGGWPCEMSEIRALAASRGLRVLEDCAQAHGAEYDGAPVGSLGDASAFSFCQDKIITTGGEGGLFAKDDDEVWLRAWAFKDHGKSYHAVHRSHPPGFRWLHESFGSNYRMTELQAAIGRIQLRKLPEWSDRRLANWRVLHRELGEVPGLRTPAPGPRLRHACYRFYAYIEPVRLRSGWTRDRIVQEVASRGVPCFSGSCSEIYRERAFDRTGFAPGESLPVARRLGETSIALLVHPTLGEAEMLKFAATVREVFADAVR